MFLIDSSVWIEYLKPQGSAAVKQQVREILQKEQAACCGIVVVELLRGARNRKDYDVLHGSLLSLPQLPLDKETIERAALWGHLLDRKGKVVSTTDLLIAASAHKKAVVLHADSHFELIAGETGLKEEYVAP